MPPTQKRTKSATAAVRAPLGLLIPRPNTGPFLPAASLAVLRAGLAYALDQDPDHLFPGASPTFPLFALLSTHEEKAKILAPGPTP